VGKKKEGIKPRAGPSPNSRKWFSPGRKEEAVNLRKSKEEKGAEERNGKPASNRSSERSGPKIRKKKREGEKSVPIQETLPSPTRPPGLNLKRKTKK